MSTLDNDVQDIMRIVSKFEPEVPKLFGSIWSTKSINGDPAPMVVLCQNNRPEDRIVQVAPICIWPEYRADGDFLIIDGLPLQMMVELWLNLPIKVELLYKGIITLSPRELILFQEAYLKTRVGDLVECKSLPMSEVMALDQCRRSQELVDYQASLDPIRAHREYERERVVEVWGDPFEE